MQLRSLFSSGARERMIVSFDTVSVTVHRNFPVRLVCPADACVACVSGTAWITTEADTCDVVLQAGQLHRASGGDRLFINGMPVCELRIESARALA